MEEVGGAEAVREMGKVDKTEGVAWTGRKEMGDYHVFASALQC